ncbi:putative metal-dependent hydrolase [Paenibacillus sambharensis]|uniref:Putative metal-dependent hydrolase DNH61_01710 n=1 Tax=Paenibacillus sambharensis TaxID=1803190 RepID=A0A2W1M217_9BACL|nr:bacillithiol transferase BstA [Paenibacillus sambharensis]PZD97687.1 putative metal-dependent hydrolase [Paenibacillus sambharensis]
MITEEQLKYPIGQYSHEGEITQEQLEVWLQQLEELPGKLREAVAGLEDWQLDTPYREGGWTIRQVVHHLADSHMNSFTRFKLAITENGPTIRPYDEKKWAELVDSRTAPIEWSLDWLDILHRRWCMLLRSLTTEQLHRTFFHPDSVEWFRLDWNIGMYAWHGSHHAAHITELCRRMNW